MNLKTCLTHIHICNTYEQLALIGVTTAVIVISATISAAGVYFTLKKLGG